MSLNTYDKSQVSASARKVGETMHEKKRIYIKPVVFGYEQKVYPKDSQVILEK